MGLYPATFTKIVTRMKIVRAMIRSILGMLYPLRRW
jgi:hypothetical protein